MGILLWIVLGAVAGFIAGKITNSESRGFLVDVIVGILGSNIGGFVATRFLGMKGVSGFNLYSLLVAIGGATILLVLVRLIRGK